MGSGTTPCGAVLAVFVVLVAVTDELCCNIVILRLLLIDNVVGCRTCYSQAGFGGGFCWLDRGEGQKSIVVCLFC